MFKFAIAVASAVALSATAQAATIVNGSFESGVPVANADFGANGFVSLDAGSSSITGWTIVSGNVDYIASHWAAGEGSRSVDLNGTQAAVIAQTFATSVGSTYTVNFLLAGNPDANPGARLLQVSAANDSSVYTFDTTGTSRLAMGWEAQTFVFTAVDAFTTLSFHSLTAGAYGPALDAVSIAAVPEPATWALMIAGFGLVGGAMRRRSTAVSFA